MVKPNLPQSTRLFQELDSQIRDLQTCLFQAHQVGSQIHYVWQQILKEGESSVKQAQE